MYRFLPMKSVIWQNLTSQAESFTGSHHRSWQDSQSPIKRNVWPILKFLQGKSQHVALATEADSWNPPGVLRGSSFSLTYFCPDVIQSPLTLCWTPGEGGTDKRIPTKTTSLPLPCSRRVLGGQRKKEYGKEGDWRSTGGPSHAEKEALWVLLTLSFCLPLHRPLSAPDPTALRSLPLYQPIYPSWAPTTLTVYVSLQGLSSALPVHASVALSQNQSSWKKGSRGRGHIYTYG